MLRSFRWRPALLCIMVAAVNAPAARAGDIDKFLPKDTDVVVSVNVQQTLESSLVKKYVIDWMKSTLSSNKEAQVFLNAVGIDPFKDFRRITIGLSIDDPSSPKYVLIAEGKFDAQKISDALEVFAKKEDKKLSKETVDGHAVFKMVSPDQPGPTYGAPIDSNILVFGSSKEYIGAAFDAVKGTRKPEIKKELAALIDKADSKSSLYVVAQTKGKLDVLPLPEAAKMALSKIESLMIDLKVQRDVNLELNVGTESADAAKEMSKMITGGIDILKFQLKTALAQPEMQPILDLVGSLKAGPKEKAVVVTGKVEGDQIDKALGKDK